MISKSKKVLITGASGKVGKHLAKQLIEKGYSVRVLIHKTKLESSGINDVEMLKGDLIDPSSLKSAVEGVEIVCHMAAVFDIFPPYKYETDNDIVYKFNVTGTYNLMEAIRKSGSVKHIIFGSSESVYASDVREHKNPITEEEELFPGRFYSLTKILGEDMVRHYRNLHGIDFTILRLAWILDASDIVRIFEYETWEGMIAEGEREELTRRCSKNKALFIPTYEDGSARIDHIVDAEDAALAAALSVQNPASRGKTFNIAGSAPFQYDAVIEDIAKRLGLSWHKGKIIGAFPYELSIKKAERIIGYRPKCSIESTLAKALKL